MDIKGIKDPSFLKGLDAKQCQQLADEIRHFMISSLSKTGGHLASNLGVIELTIALHKFFNTPKDKLFFDVGHQCYTHKILTGRANQFDTLRQYGGISGFQKRSESPYDVYEAGHSSTSLSAALGMAIARDLNHEDYQIIPVIGDGALESGMALEALNQIGEENRRMIIIFNDNHMSISKNVGFLSRNFAKLRINPKYTEIKQEVKSGLSRSDLGNTIYTQLKSLRNNVRELMVDGGVFEEFGLDYLGPIDGHDIDQLLKALNTANEKAKDHTVVIHICTTKGKGYAPCESQDIENWHGVGPFNIETGELLQKTPENQLPWSKVFADGLESLAKDNKDIIAITPAMKVGSKLKSFFDKYPDRSIDTGIAEEHAATLASGLAISGKRPYLCVYSTFLQRAYDQINHDICRMDLPVVIGIDRAGLVGADGDTHHGVFDIGLLRALPNMILAQPKDDIEAYQLLNTAFSQNHPFAIRYGRGNTLIHTDKKDSLIPIGSWEVIGDLNDNNPIICTYGDAVNKVIETFKERYIKATIINCRFFKPLDESIMQQLFYTDSKIIVYETDMIAEGLASAMQEYATLNHQTLKLEVIGIKDHYVTHGDVKSLEKQEGIDIESLIELVNN